MKPVHETTSQYLDYDECMDSVMSQLCKLNKRIQNYKRHDEIRRNKPNLPSGNYNLLLTLTVTKLFKF